MPEVRLIDANSLKHSRGIAGDEILHEIIDNQPTIEAEPVRHGRWIECDYKEIRHGEIWTEHRAGLCCSECRTAFQKKKMTYKQYCAACGAKMDGGADNG